MKVNDELGLIIGFAVICTEDGEPYVDTQDENVPEDAMFKASTEFMIAKREARVMHGEDRIGDVVFAWPMTQEIAESMDIVTKRTGLMVMIKPASDEVLEKARKGDFSGFSIGGVRIQSEDVEDD